jgi:hyperosmotically inducible periplasmic protein
MFRALLRLVVVLVILVAVGAFFLGWWGSGRTLTKEPAAIGTAGRISTEKAREVGADVAAKTAQAANKAGELLTDGALTAKIKSKMALDDLVKARTIDVTTVDHVVTLKGTVGSVAEHDRAVALAKETVGVTQVVDKLGITR